MPNYIDLLGNQIENNKDKFIQYLTKGIELKYLKSDYKEKFDKYFIPIKDKILSDENFESLAIDASGNKREFMNGMYFYINRAYGAINTGEFIRDLETDVFSISGPGREAETYIGWKAEYLEFKVLESYIDNQNGENQQLKVAFIDGSLYSRLMHPIFESTVMGDEYFILKYLELYYKVLNETKKKIFYY